ncbi:MAG TPA: SusC/RagA family TonB-linked outer membrane protein [Gemmatimonadaceae bacterium]|nr:SusC/RagA family TonB-linked outer membrane protein [Gemmatimonadaceae bacterium]
MRSIRLWSVVRYLAVVVFVAITAIPVRAQQATVTGRVTSAGTNVPLGDSRVTVVGTSLIAAANADGQYTLRNVPPGAVIVRVLRVGYLEGRRAVTVVPGRTTTLDFTLDRAVVQLQEIVTTATGQQARSELGNAVSTLGDVNKKVETTPIANLGDLLVAKSPGVVVLPGAMTGSAPVIRIRGLGSLATTGSGVTNNPIYVVDGVRVNTGSVSLSTGGTTASLINDFDPNEIEDVEIVKGPSAATLYGTDAANGVIVITTKKGHAGVTRWAYYGEVGGVSDRNKYPSTYASWGHDATGATTRCTLVTESQGTCTLDSLTSYNVLTNPSTTPNRLGNRQAYGMNASGGSEQVRFFVAGNWQNELGPIHMPSFAQRTLDSMGTALRDEWVNPEAFQSYGARANLSASFTPKFDLNANAGFSETNQRLPQTDNNTYSYIYSALNNPGFNHNGLNYNELGTLNEYRNGYGGFSPAQIFQVAHINGTQRFIGSMDATWRPIAWMQNDGTIGLDLADNNYGAICRYSECPNSGTQRQGTVTATQTNLRNFSAKLVSGSTWQARSDLNFRTTLGADYSNLERDIVTASGQNLPPGAQTVGDAATKTNVIDTLPTVNKTLGVYLQEQGSFRDRLFLIVAARSDQNSSFGTKFQRVFYPKASISWIVSDESFFPRPDWLNQFRLRSAYGASGVQPGGAVALQTFGATTANIASVAGSATAADIPGLVAQALGNADLKPERSTETEAGFEMTVLNSRAHFDFTYYSKRTHDALVSQPIAASSGASQLTVLKNLSSVANTGVEVEFNTAILDRSAIGWDVTIAGSHNSNKIVALGNDASGKPLPTIGTGTSRDSVGLPVNAFFARPFQYNDANGDGIITPDEVTVGSSFVYAGYSLPRDIISVTNGFDLMNHRLRITVLTDYKGGYSLFNQSGQFYSQQFATWYSRNVKTTSLYDQARTVANSGAKNPSTVMGYLENGQYWKLREVSAALTLPNVASQRIRAHDAQLVFSARNLHTWTKYTGVDPESNYSTGDVQTDFSTTAPRTYFVVRANLHY